MQGLIQKQVRMDQSTGTHASTRSFQGQYLFSKYLLKSTGSVTRLKAQGRVRKTSSCSTEHRLWSCSSKAGRRSIPSMIRVREALVGLWRQGRGKVVWVVMVSLGEVGSRKI